MIYVKKVVKRRSGRDLEKSKEMKEKHLTSQ